MRPKVSLGGLSTLNPSHIEVMPPPPHAVELALSGKVSVLVKGSLHTDELLGAVVSPGLRTERRISHVFVMDVPSLCQAAGDYGCSGQYPADPRA